MCEDITASKSNISAPGFAVSKF